VEFCDDLASVFDSGAAKKLAFVTPGFEQLATCLVNFASVGGQEDHWPVSLDALAGSKESHKFRTFDVHLDDVWRGDSFLKQ